MIDRQQRGDLGQLLQELDPRAEREARKVSAQEAEKALSDYQAAQQAFHANRERLKAERLAREAAAPEASRSRGVRT